LIEATSGNTSFAMALMTNHFYMQIELIMPSSSTKERVLMMEAFGAKVTLLDSMGACHDNAEEKGASDDYFLLNQFADPDNYWAQFNTTGPEIWPDT
jgi:S-sulfo-L-cysteine synthase (O-acetyl-L-serine-dependent)